MLAQVTLTSPTQVSLTTHARTLLLLAIPHALLLAELLTHHSGSNAMPLLLCEVIREEAESGQGESPGHVLLI